MSVPRKLSPSDVKAIREEYANSAITCRKLAERYGVNHSTIAMAINGRKWGGAGGPTSSAGRQWRKAQREKCPTADALDAEVIRASYATGITQQALAAEYGVSVWRIWNIVGSHGIRTKLTEESVRAILSEHARGGLSAVELAAKYGVSRGAIDGIIYRRTWKHVEGVSRADAIIQWFACANKPINPQRRLSDIDAIRIFGMNPGTVVQVNRTEEN